MRAAVHYYGGAWDQFWLGDEDNLHLPYEKVLTNYLESGMVYSNWFSKYMGLLGYETHEVVTNIQGLQKIWARDNNFTYQPDQWKREIFFAQIRSLRPDILFIQSRSTLNDIVENFEELKQEFPFVKKILLMSGYPEEGNLKGVDVIFAAPAPVLDFYQQRGYNCILLYHGFDPGVLPSLSNSGFAEEIYDFTFLGSSGFGHGLGHKTRYWTLVELALRTNITMFIYDPPNVPGNLPMLKAVSPGGKLRERFKRAFFAFFDENDMPAIENLEGKLRLRLNHGFLARQIGVVKTELRGRAQTSRFIKNTGLARETIEEQLPGPLFSLFGDRCLPPRFGLDMYRTLGASKVTFNIHTDAANGFVGNIRLFEATGAGTCLLTDRGKNMKDLFDEDRELVTYSSVDECISKLRFLLENEQERKKIAEAGQKRTLKDHSFQNRAMAIDEVISSL